MSLVIGKKIYKKTSKEHQKPVALVTLGLWVLIPSYEYYIGRDLSSYP
jgi:hypothetical protein